MPKDEQQEASQPVFPKFKRRQPFVEMVDIVHSQEGKKTVVHGFVVREIGEEDATFIPFDEFHRLYEPAEE